MSCAKRIASCQASVVSGSEADHHRVEAPVAAVADAVAERF